MSTPVPSFAQPGWADFLRGLSLPFTAVGLVFRSRKLFLLSLLASVVTFVALAALLVFLPSATGSFLGLFWARPEGWVGAALWYVVAALTFVVLLVVGANTVPLLLLAPLQDPLSEATEELCGGFFAPPFSLGLFLKGALASIAHTLKRITLLLGGHALLLALHLLPGIGSIVWTVASTLWTMWWLSAEYLSGVMARHLYRFRDVVPALWSRKRLALGFGAAIYVLLWIPVLNLFFIPLAVVAGTLLFRGLRAAGALSPPALQDLR
ncbi:MAG: EI24 domain-containing protein [Myxococcota bacterium]